MRLDVHRLVLVTCYVAAAAVVGWLAWQGSDYYATPLIERPRHEDFWALKPGGTRGHLLGVIGSSLMVVMLVYSLRKRVAVLRRAGEASGLARLPHLLRRRRPAAGDPPQLVQGAGAGGPELLVDDRRGALGRARPLSLSADPAHAGGRRAEPRRGRRAARAELTRQLRERAPRCRRPPSPSSTASPWPARVASRRRLAFCLLRLPCRLSHSRARLRRASGARLQRASSRRSPASTAAARSRAAGPPEGRARAAHRALEPAAAALPLLARLPQAVRGRDVRVHGRPHRGGLLTGYGWSSGPLTAAPRGTRAAAALLLLAARPVSRPALPGPAEPRRTPRSKGAPTA